MRPGPRRGFRWTHETVSYAIELWHRRHLCTPTLDDWARAGIDHPSATTVKELYGSWNRAIAASGFAPRRQGQRRRRRPRPFNLPAEPTPRWNHARVVHAMQAWAAEHGEPPRLREWRLARETTPTASTVRRLFGSWNEAIAAAGFEPRLP